MSSTFRLFPESASSIAPQVDALTWSLLGASGFIIVLVIGLVLVFGIRYRSGAERNRFVTHASKRWQLEIFWTLVPFFIFLGLFFWAGHVYFQMHSPPKNAMQIHVIAKQWMWRFEHEDGYKELAELHVPVGKPVELIMSSEDVIHSLFVPAFRMKQDILPGRYTSTWFQATKTGEFQIFCTQYCGTFHSGMLAKLIVMSPEHFEKWLETRLRTVSLGSGSSAIERGKRIYETHACISCHEGSVMVKAPNLTGVYGSEVQLSDGSTVLADENYLRESILNPGAKTVNGFPPLMPSFQGQMSEEDLVDLIAYLKSRRPK